MMLLCVQLIPIGFQLLIAVLVFLVSIVPEIFATGIIQRACGIQSSLGTDSCSHGAGQAPEFPVVHYTPRQVFAQHSRLAIFYDKLEAVYGRALFYGRVVDIVRERDFYYGKRSIPFYQLQVIVSPQYMCLGRHSRPVCLAVDCSGRDIL